MRPFLLLTVFVAAASAGKKMGCFQKKWGDWNVYSSLQHMGGAGSPAKCEQLCSGYAYFGLVSWSDGDQCACSNESPYAVGANQLEDRVCDKACEADRSQKCGATNPDGNPFVVYEAGPAGPTEPPAPTTPRPTRAPRPTQPPCEDEKAASFCEDKCGNEKDCAKKRCAKCEKTCGVCGPQSFGDATGDCSAAAYDYAEVLDKSMLFYEAQRAGPLPADNRIPWRGDSNLNDDPVGGYYDAGDFLKFGLPMAHMTTQLAWGAINFQEGYEKTGQMKYIKDTIKWATDYFVDANRLPNEFIGQIGAGDADHGYWGRAEDMNMNRPVYSVSPSKPGSDLAGETAAALAAASIFYNNIGDSALAEEALDNAIELFDFADQYRGKYSDSIWDASKFYNSWSGYMDELAWGAAWLYRATGDASYLQKAEDFFDSGEMCNSNLWFGWDNKKAGVEVLMYEITGDAKYQKCVDNFMNEVDGATYTPKGLIFVDNWGSNRHAGNLAHLAAQLAYMGYKETKNNAFVEKQIGYILGDTGRSYMVGFGVNPPLRPHHRGSSCRSPITSSCGSAEKNSPAANPQTLYGAIVGGPDGNDQYNDARDDYISNEVATDYNAGVQSAVAYLAMMNC